jgi:hypothetical protein
VLRIIFLFLVHHIIYLTVLSCLLMIREVTHLSNYYGEKRYPVLKRNNVHTVVFGRDSVYFSD